MKMNSATSTKPKRQKYNLGSIVAIPLPDGRYAFAKVFKNYGFAIYGLVLDHIPDASKVIHQPIVFFHSGTDDGIKKGLWPVIGEQPFADPEDAWAPPKATCYDWDENRWTMGVPKISHKGQTLTATLEQVKGLDIFTFSPNPEGFAWVIDKRLIKGQNEEYKVRAS
jgi:hypothetical protein